MKIEIEKKLVNDEIIKTEELIFTIPKAIYDELDWEDGTVVEWDITKQENEDVDNNKVRILLRNIDDKILDWKKNCIWEYTYILIIAEEVL